MKWPLPRLWRSPDIAIDLGTAVTRLGVATGDAVFSAPSEIGSTRALRGGAIADVRCATAVLEPLIRLARSRRFGQPRALACVPTDANKKERSAVITAVRAAGAADVALVPEPLAAAVGAGVDLASPRAQLLIDIGYGVTDCAVIREGQILATAARRIACNDLEKVVRRHVRNEYRIELDANETRRVLGLMRFDPIPHAHGTVRVSGRARPSGGECAIEIDLSPVAVDLLPVYEQITSVVRHLLRNLSDKVGAELVENGLHLTGGGALLSGVSTSIARQTGLSVHVVSDPLAAVVRGGQRILPTIAVLERWR